MGEDLSLFSLLAREDSEFVTQVMQAVVIPAESAEG